MASGGLLGLAASRGRRGPRAVRLALAFAIGALVAVDGLVYRYYHTVLTDQVVSTALHDWADARPIVLRLLPACLALTVPVAALEYLWLRAFTFSLGLRAHLAIAASVLAALGVLDDYSLTPDLRAIHATSLVWKRLPTKATTNAFVPRLESTESSVPSVLVVLTESVRDESYCSGSTSECSFSPEVNALFPNRIPLRQMRSVASYTALSLSSLLTGRTLLARDADVAPTLFDYLHATRVDGRGVWVGYWSAQAATVLERDVGASIDSLVTMETILGHGVDDEDDAVLLDMDQRLVSRSIPELSKLPHPFFLMLHLLGTHAPYFVNAERAPFQPTGRVVTWTGLPALKNAYHDAIVAQDHTLASFLRAFVEAEGQSPWIILFTSDHGEAFGEHGAIHHGQNLYDEQIHVPGWVVASPRAISRAQREHLAAHEDAFVTHLDVVPTVLDVFGALGSLGMAPLQSKLEGTSVFASRKPLAPIPMTNCTSMFPCPLNTWGVLGEGRALVAQPWDGDWNCVDLLGRGEHVNDAGCTTLRVASRRFFSSLPGGRPNESAQ